MKMPSHSLGETSVRLWQVVEELEEEKVVNRGRPRRKRWRITQSVWAPVRLSIRTRTALHATHLDFPVNLLD